MAYAEVPGGYLYFEQRGAGPDVVLLNGGLADTRMWDSTVDWLSACARVTTWDYRDNGLSSTSSAPYDEIGDLLAVLDAAGIDRAVLVGVSDGARRALGFAHQHPDRVTKVCAVAGSFGEFPDPTAAEEAARIIMRAHFARIGELLDSGDIPATAAYDIAAWCPRVPDPARRLLTNLAIANSRILQMPEAHGQELDPPVKHRFAELKPPVHVLIGKHDFAGTQLWTHRLATQARETTLSVLPHADHMPMFSAPAAFREWLTHHASSSSATRSRAKRTPGQNSAAAGVIASCCIDPGQ
ncbi:alpha/beta hydrolase [Kribbella sandramycini]|uniref:Alpha/beta hydrolase n=1 Tax=Kribbella sandramycini TaxID=60450 RepID=A0A7Y4KYH9_9ACTN|nr:alpha/beta hydrolase [Kribbella sandramycini]MBB6569184.1 non-heme chloroperoxidase [Kribbella sandramycini]NOL40975.1 alpha/beta hydrolase [Kribbella sandramycini]